MTENQPLFYAVKIGYDDTFLGAYSTDDRAMQRCEQHARSNLMWSRLSDNISRGEITDPNDDAQYAVGPLYVDLDFTQLPLISQPDQPPENG